MTYFFNIMADMCAAPMILLGIGFAIWAALRSVRAYLDWDWERNYIKQQRAIELQAQQHEADKKAIEKEKLGLDTQLVTFDPTRPVVSRNGLVSGQFDPAMLLLAAEYLKTLQPVANVPQTLTYSPHFSSKSESHQLPSNAPTIALPVENQIGDFLEVFNKGLLPKDKFLIGQNMDDGELVTATWRDFYSTLIGGASGSGKSTLVRSLLAQAALQGSKFMVIDPHFGAGDESLGESLAPLQSRMLTAVASTNNQMLATLKNVTDIGKRRLDGIDKDKTPVVLIVDETTGLLQRGEIKDQLLDTLGFIAQETRKVCVYTICIGQMFTAKVMPSEVRNCFVNFISCRTRKSNARYMTDNSEFAEIAADLTIGQCVRMSPSGEVTRITIPNCTQNHLEFVAENGEKDERFLTSHSGNLTSQEEENNDCGSHTEVTRKSNGSLAEVRWSFDKDNQIDPETRRIIDLYCSGHSVSDIVKDLNGGEITAGRRLQQESDKVQGVIRDYLNALRSI